ncbi:MAG: InlB B-repeat-containing protein [Bacilli bacterium]|nr:InlB B-repeat-containing protein [Bacilli bacterium]
MRKNNKFIIFILILFISIGFAYLSTNLYISGTSIVKRSVWDVHFNNIQNETCTYQIDSNAAISSNSKEVDFTFTFEKPGDSYSFNVDVVNTGNIDAMLESYNVVGLPDEASYLEWNVLYDDGISFTKYDSLPANSTETLFITVKFKEDVNINDLPTEADTSFNLKFIANYVQADNNATTRESGTYNIRYLLDGGTISNNPTTYTIRSGATIPNPTKEGYTFTGWTVGKNLFSVNGISETQKNVTFIASNNNIIISNPENGPSTNGGDIGSIPINYRIPAGTYVASAEYISGSFNTDFVWYKLLSTIQGYNVLTIENMDFSTHNIITFNQEVGRFSVGFRNNCTFDNLNINLQVEEGENATPYEPYISEPTKDIVILPGMSGNRTYKANWEAI